MPKLIPYINFNGKCREAMTFYKECLGGEVNFMTAEETGAAKEMPPEMHKTIMHSSLASGDFVLHGSDMVGETAVEGNTHWLLLECSSEVEIRSLYASLADGGKPTGPLQDTFWGALFGTLEDKFGNYWMFNFQKSPIT